MSTSSISIVSVIMPSYNQARFIRNAIESVLSQSYPHVELIVMDGGSTDETLKILSEYGEELVYHSMPDSGQSQAINRGIARAKGDMISWLNCDDKLESGAIELVVEAFERNPGVLFLYGKGWVIDKSGRRIRQADVRPFDLWKLIHHRDFIQQPSCFFRKTLYEEAGPVDESLNYVMDWDLWIRFAQYGEPLFLPHTLSSNRTYPENKTLSGGLTRWREIRRMVRKHTTLHVPPVIPIYFLEIMIQAMSKFRLLRFPRRILGRLFGYGMRREFSGRFPDGGVKRRWNFSIGITSEASHIEIAFTPLSKYMPSMLGKAPVKFGWKSSLGRSGCFEIEETGKLQVISIPRVNKPGRESFEHLKLRGNTKGITVDLDRRSERLVGFVDKINLA